LVQKTYGHFDYFYLQPCALSYPMYVCTLCHIVPAAMRRTVLFGVFYMEM
jgi:hypothetical protein